MSPSDTPASSPTRSSAIQVSPRPSLDSQNTHSNSFLHNRLTHRLRRRSSASSQSHASEVPPQPDPVVKTQASRSARRMLLAMVKDDWDYPTTTVRDNNGIPHREPLGYRLRDESLSDIDAEERIAAKHRSKSDPYRFENPDAVGNLIAERKRKRRKLVEEELKWNEGVRTWTNRRDAWTGAVKQKPSESTRPAPKKKIDRPSNIFRRHTSQSSGSWTASPTTPTPESSSIESVDEGVGKPDGPWLPIFPPIMPSDDVIRDRIKPQAYPTIYSKIVVQGLAPNVPIPLKHMIPALVEGWKSEGNWPPQPASMAPQDLKLGRKSSAFTKWRKEHHHDARAAEHVHGGEDGRSRVRRSISMMKRVMGVGPGDDELEDLGIEFREQDEDEMAKNVTLNKGLLEH
ncbi:hypothetical protein PV11_05237 [Exophiala sideris]|uniref:Gag1-like clamp domain-containing protein n=1 Tax=Exophiala sideris TaxID=1016849 RepID=A0A0D1YJY2_9EURO|nr:hypothetical protein PV11_05237 [Exophiala sideris]